MRRYKHNLSNYVPTTLNMGQMIPINCVEVLRGDTFKASTSAFLRASTLLKPLMHPVHVHIHHVYVPMQQVWDDWESFITGGEDFDDESVVPTITFDGTGDNPDPVTVGSLPNQFGLPVGFDGTVDAYKYRAYVKAWNHIYRDDQLQDEVPLSTEGGPDTTTSTELLHVNWNQDVFTSARPDDILGTGVNIPLGADTAPVRGIGKQNGVFGFSDEAVRETGGVDTTYENASFISTTSGNYNTFLQEDPDNPGYPLIYADLQGASGIELEAFKSAFAAHNLQQTINRTGNTYPDFLARYGVRDQDLRLKEPEYIAGGKQTVQFSEVVTTAEGDNTNVGDLKGHGIAAVRSNNFVKWFPDDGFLISFMFIKPLGMYMDGIHKSWNRPTRYDYYQKEFDILGMQPILNKEIQWDHSDPDGVFGFNDNNYSYMSMPNQARGEFSDPTNIEAMSYHLGRHFTGDVSLGSSFITCNPDDRIFADTNVAQFQCFAQNRIAARRYVPNKPKKMVISL